MNLMHTKATVKGQVLIPVALRRKYGIKKGTRISITEEKAALSFNRLRGTSSTV